MKRFVFVLVLLVMVALMVTSCDSCEVVCCKTVEYWWGATRDACRTMRSDDCDCPSGWTLQGVLSYPER